MRYLTHESEDAWWDKQGAKPHPLVTLMKQKYSHHTYNNIVILEEPRPGAPSIATTAAIARLPNPSQSKTNEEDNTKKELVEGKKSYLDLSNTDVEQLESHARRVGYTVSTV
jgi:hypothetical protein